MGYLTAKQFSEKWGISERRIIKLCKESRIEGAIKNGMVWTIPEDTIKPSDKRSKISKYINTQKRVLIVNFNNQIGEKLISLLKKNGYIVDGLYCNKIIEKDLKENIEYWKCNYSNKEDIQNVLSKVNKYYDGLVILDIEISSRILNKEFIIKEFSKKLNCESSIVVVNNLEAKLLNENLPKIIKEKVGANINQIKLTEKIAKNVLMNFNELAENIFLILTKFKNTTGQTICTDLGALVFGKNGKTNELETGKYYKAITHFFKNLNKDSYMWCASTMMEDEWTEEPLEMDFRVQNLDAANRGAKMDRIFIFSKSKIKEFKNNKTLKIYMQSNINTMFVDYDEVKQKEPDLLKIVGDGWDGINKDYLLVDLPAGKEPRGYISINKQEINKAYNCFIKLKKYAKSLKEVLK